MSAKKNLLKMSKLFLVIALLISSLLCSQEESTQSVVSFSMGLESVISVSELADGWVEVISTEAVQLHYAERVIRLQSGAWRFQHDLDWGTLIRVSAAPSTDPADTATYTRWIKTGLFRLDLQTGSLQPWGYLEVSVCDDK